MGGNAGENQIPSQQNAQQGQVSMRPSRLARAVAWARARPEWQPEFDRLMQRYAASGLASEQEVTVGYLT